MANSFKALTLALFLCLGGTAHAGYAQAIPPQGWSTAGFKATAANGASFFSGGVRANAVINVGGRSVVMPATMRFAANAPRIAAGLMFVNPGLAAGIRAAGWLAAAGLAYDAASGLWQKSDSEYPEIISDGFTYRLTVGRNLLESRSKSEMCSLVGAAIVSSFGYYALVSAEYTGESSSQIVCSISYRPYPNSYMLGSVRHYPVKYPDSSCPVGWYVTPAGCTQTPQPKTVTEEEFLEELTKAPMPEELPLEIPAPLPVELPEISPVFIPTGDPILNPKYNPQAEPTPENQPWIQPGVRVQPSPTPAQPWRVDLQPQNRPKSDSTPLPDVQPDSGSQNQPGTEPANPGLCDQYPDILACAKLEEPENPGPLKTIDIGGDFEILGGFAGSKVCPSFPTIDMLPGLSWQPFCDQLARIRPLVLAFAWLSAVMIILRFGRK